jgi:transposase-like protein
MALEKNVKSQAETVVLEVPTASDLPSRIERISEQTGLSFLNIIQKWVLQEESLIGLMQRGRNQTRVQTATEQIAVRKNTSLQEDSDVRKQMQEELLEVSFDSPNYRKMLVKRAKKLRKGGMSSAKIAELFNEEKISTVTGKGKWYSSSVLWILSANM